ncbi:MAG: class II D-tagatose-bisphosphate aldolase, non-catalytic subunit [Candidatus Kaelpia imicola]|nr:class II D-tagatose-bisphosphate aldolase, non-catalytic subunit [Candidatus Kaelpia imicola]
MKNFKLKKYRFNCIITLIIFLFNLNVAFARRIQDVETSFPNSVVDIVDEARRKGVTVLFIGPQSPLIVDSAILAARIEQQPLIFIPSRNQVDMDEFGGGYVEGWNQERFVGFVRQRMQELGASDVPVYFYRDHSGPWQRDEEFREAISAEEAMQRAKMSLLADLKAGFNVLHIDASRSPHSSECVELGKVQEMLMLQRTVELIEYVENQRCTLGLPAIQYEVRGERKYWDQSMIEITERFLVSLKRLLELRGLNQDLIGFVTVNPSPLRERGTSQAVLDEDFVQRLAASINEQGYYVKYHNGDFMDPSDREKLSSLGVYTLNVAPEVPVVQTRALLALADEETRILENVANNGLVPSHLREVITEAVFLDGRWKKWVPLTEGWSEEDVRSDHAKLKEVVEFNAHYSYGDSEVQGALRLLEQNMNSLRYENYLQLFIQSRIITKIMDFYESLDGITQVQSSQHSYDIYGDKIISNVEAIREIQENTGISRPITVAITGDMAAGKTTFVNGDGDLNIQGLKKRLEDKGHTVVLIDDEMFLESRETRLLGQSSLDTNDRNFDFLYFQHLFDQNAMQYLFEELGSFIRGSQAILSVPFQIYDRTTGRRGRNINFNIPRDAVIIYSGVMLNHLPHEVGFDISVSMEYNMQDTDEVLARILQRESRKPSMNQISREELLQRIRYDLAAYRLYRIKFPFQGDYIIDVSSFEEPILINNL